MLTDVPQTAPSDDDETRMTTMTDSGFTPAELDHLHHWGARVGVEVVVVADGPHSGDESAYVGLGDQGATWALYRAAGRLWLHRLQAVAWGRQVHSVQEATGRMGVGLVSVPGPQ